MEFWVIIMIGLPVLYITGSLRKTVTNTGVNGTAFVLFFLCVAALSLLPLFEITKSISMSAAGVFACVSPLVYLTVKRKIKFLFLIMTTFMLAISVIVTFLWNSYAVPNLSLFVTAFAVLSSILCCKQIAPVFLPVLIGVFSIAKSTIEMSTQIYSHVVLFEDTEMVMIGVCICLIVAYVVTKPRGKHARKRNRQRLETLEAEKSE